MQSSTNRRQRLQTFKVQLVCLALHFLPDQTEPRSMYRADTVVRCANLAGREPFIAGRSLLYAFSRSVTIVRAQHMLSLALSAQLPSGVPAGWIKHTGWFAPFLTTAIMACLDGLSFATFLLSGLGAAKHEAMFRLECSIHSGSFLTTGLSIYKLRTTKLVHLSGLSPPPSHC